MKRFAISALVLASAFACTTSIESAAPGADPVQEEEVAAADVLPGLPVEPHAAPVVEATRPVLTRAPLAAAADDTKDFLPTGGFADVRAFCAAQMKLAAPIIAQANRDSKDSGMGELDARPSCKESPAVLIAAKIDPTLSLKAVTVETGASHETFLLEEEAEGWTAVRTAFLTDDHNDPGCGSIERPVGINEIRSEAGSLVVTTMSDRMWWNNEEGGQLTLTYARSCRAGVACVAPSVVDAKVVLDDVEESTAPKRTRFFTTAYAVAADGVILPARAFDESKL